METKAKTNFQLCSSQTLHKIKPHRLAPPTISTRVQYVDESGRVLYKTEQVIMDNTEKLSQLRVSDFSMTNLIVCGADKHLRSVSMSKDTFSSTADIERAISKMQSSEERATTDTNNETPIVES